MISRLYGKNLQKWEKKRAKRRPLFLLWKNSYRLWVGSPKWLHEMRDTMLKLLQETRLIVYGGSYKDVILIGDYAFTFSIVPKGGTEQKTLRNVIKKINKMPLFYRERLNAPLSWEKDVYVDQKWFLDDNQRKVNVLITRTPLCSNGSLDKYGQRLVKNNSVRLQRFGQLVYELTKVMRKLFKEKMFHLDIKPANIFVCQGKNGVKFSMGDIDGLQFCKSINCYKALPVSTSFFLPYHGAIKKGADAFMNRDTYALMKTFLQVFFDMFYPRGNNHDVKSIMRYRDCDETYCQMPDEPHSEDDVNETYLDVDFAVNQIEIHDNKKKFESYNNIDKEEALNSLTEMMDEVLALVSAIDRGFYENYMYAPKILEIKLRRIQTLSKKIGAKPSASQQLKF